MELSRGCFVALQYFKVKGRFPIKKRENTHNPWDEMKGTLKKRNAPVSKIYSLFTEVPVCQRPES